MDFARCPLFRFTLFSRSGKIFRTNFDTTKSKHKKLWLKNLSYTVFLSFVVLCIFLFKKKCSKFGFEYATVRENLRLRPDACGVGDYIAASKY